MQLHWDDFPSQSFDRRKSRFLQLTARLVLANHIQLQPSYNTKKHKQQLQISTNISKQNLIRLKPGLRSCAPSSQEQDRAYATALPGVRDDVDDMKYKQKFEAAIISEAEESETCHVGRLVETTASSASAIDEDAKNAKCQPDEAAYGADQSSDKPRLTTDIRRRWFDRCTCQSNLLPINQVSIRD